MHLTSRQKRIGLLLLVAMVLLFSAWLFGWLSGEPRHKGRTVSEWLDSLVLYTNETRSNGDVITMYRPPEQIVTDPAFQALQAIGPRGTQVLMERIAEPAGYPPEMSRAERWRIRWQWTWYRLRGSGKATRPPSGSWPPSQTARKTAAAFLLVVLGTNGQGGVPRLMATCATAPQFTSQYGAKLAGPPLGFAPSASFHLAWKTQPQLREEFVAGLREALQHTNEGCRLMARDCARHVPELRDLLVESERRGK